MIFKNLRIRRAVAGYARRLPPWLMHAYGRHDFYTEAQLRRAVQEAGLNPKFIALAFANYLSSDNYARLFESLPVKVHYQTARIMFLQRLPVVLASRDGEASPDRARELAVSSALDVSSNSET